MCVCVEGGDTHVINNVTISYPSLLKILQTGLLQLIRASRIHFVSVRVTSTASKRSPDLNWHTQYEKLLLHITKSRDTDQTSGLVNSVAQKKNQGLNFVLSLFTLPFLVPSRWNKVSAALPGITSNYNIQRKERQCLFLRLYLCYEKTFFYSFPSRLPPGFISRTDVILKQDKGRRMYLIIKPFPKHPSK